MIKEEEAPPPVMASAAWWVAYRAASRVVRWAASSAALSARRRWQCRKSLLRNGCVCPKVFRQGLLIKKVQPHYPPLARQARIQGQVLLQAQISKDGSIENLLADQRTPDAGSGCD